MSKRRYDGHGFQKQARASTKRAKQILNDLEARKEEPPTPLVHECDSSEWGCDEINHDVFTDVESVGYQTNQMEIAEQFIFEPNSEPATHQEVTWDSHEWDDNVCGYLPLTVKTAYTMIMWFIVSVNLSKSGIEKLLILIQLFLPKENNLAKTRHMFEKLLGYQSTMKKYFYCKTCRLISGQTRCRCRSTMKDFIMWGEPKDVFLRRLSSLDFFSKANYYRNNRERLIQQSRGAIWDCYDGSVYKKLADPITRLNYQLTNQYGYSFIVNYDGATKWKSSLVSAIPIYLVCNELKLKERFKVENVIFCGVWYGKGKIDTNILFSLLIKDLIDFERGVKARDPYGNEIHVIARCINSCADLPAKAALFKMKQHNGKHSCYYCNNQGCTIDKRFCYPLLKRVGDLILDHSMRTNDQITQAYQHIQAQITEHPDRIPEPFCGITGITAFAALPYFSFLEFGSIDFMHQVEGLFKLLYKLWRKAKYNSHGVARITKQQWKEFEDLLLKQLLPQLFNRRLRSVEAHWKYFKASEALVFILYTSKLLTLFPWFAPYAQHHLLLMDNLYRLLTPGLTLQDLEDIQKNLVQYMLQFQELYGPQYCTSCVHLLLHLTHCVRLHGPLFCYTAFPFESYNKMVLRAIHGTYRVEKSISNAIPLYQFIHQRCLTMKDKKAAKILRQMKFQSRYHSSDEKEISIAGFNNVIAFSKKNIASEMSKLHYYKYLRVDGELFESSSLVKQQSTVNSYVRLRDGRLGMIRYIYQNTETEKWYLSIRMIRDSRFRQVESVSLELLLCLVICLFNDDTLLFSIDLLKCHSILLR